MPTSRRTTVRRPSTNLSLFAIGDVVGEHYEIRKVLGSGGMGQVFEAHDRALNRRVALKAHWPHLKEFPIRKEAQALAAIRHPAVVTVHALGTHDGNEFLVMERIPGMTLAEHLLKQRKRPHSIADAIDILTRLAEGLAAVHAAGIAHRDVKPANVMLAPNNRLVLTDFGIFLPEFEGGALVSTIGTVEYMAPEAITGNVSRGGAYLVDIYALGVVAYEMVTGERPFGGSPNDVVQQQLGAEPRPVHELRPDVPPRLAALIAAMMHKEPHDRPANMDVVLTALRTANQLGGPRPISILIGEDDSAIASVLSEFVSEVAPDASVRVARDGNAVLAHVRQAPPDLLLLDLGLPAMNGIELCMYLRGAGIAPSTRIVALSAAAQPRDVAILQQLGINTFIRKGNDWLDRVENAVQQARTSAPARPPG